MKSIEHSELHGVVGGMKWESFRRSTNIEDRRPDWAIKRDNQWLQGQQPSEPASYPKGTTTRSPAGYGS